MRRSLSYLLAIPLLAAATQFAHALAYQLVTPDRHTRAEELAGSGHGYLSYAPAALAILGALAVAALALRVLEARRGLAGSRLAAAPFALLPPLAFGFRSTSSASQPPGRSRSRPRWPPRSSSASRSSFRAL